MYRRIAERSIGLIQSGKTYCAAFCASLALLEDSGNSAGCKGGMNGGLLIRYSRMHVVRSIHLQLGKHNFFSAFQ